MNKIRTRFAPSPTGYMHVGNLRAALFEYLVGKSLGGKFILRIEDTDQKRKVDGAVDFIYDTLSLCGFKIDEGPSNGGEFGPYLQSERLSLYQKYAHDLVEKGEAYYCFCSEERISNLREEAESNKRAFMYDKHCLKLSPEDIEENLKNNVSYVIRQNVPKEGTSVYSDLVYGDIKVENSLMEDQILLKSDGFPTYNFANVVDDYLMKITHVVRGNEYLSSTPKYNLLYDAFGWDKPQYIHLPHVNGEDGKKLSKRNGDASFMDLYKDGYLPEAIINYLALLGWSPKDNKEIFSMDELVSNFDISRINKSGATFDIKKLRWVNNHYIKKLELEDLRSITVPFLKEAYGNAYSDEWLDALIKLYQKEISYGKEIVDVTDLFFQNDINYDEDSLDILNQEGVKDTLECFKDEISTIVDYTPENIKQAIINTKNKTGAKGKLLFMPIRIKVSGQMHGPELPETIFLIGKEEVISRLNR